MADSTPAPPRPWHGEGWEGVSTQETPEQRASTEGCLQQGRGVLIGPACSFPLPAAAGLGAARRVERGQQVGVSRTASRPRASRPRAAASPCCSLQRPCCRAGPWLALPCRGVACPAVPCRLFSALFPNIVPSCPLPSAPRAPQAIRPHAPSLEPNATVAFLGGAAGRAHTHTRALSLSDVHITPPSLSVSRAHGQGALSAPSKPPRGVEGRGGMGVARASRRVPKARDFVGLLIALLRHTALQTSFPPSDGLAQGL